MKLINTFLVLMQPENLYFHFCNSIKIYHHHHHWTRTAQEGTRPVPSWMAKGRLQQGNGFVSWSTGRSDVLWGPLPPIPFVPGLFLNWGWRWHLTYIKNQGLQFVGIYHKGLKML